jgi:hypothetical protein
MSMEKSTNRPLAAGLTVAGALLRLAPHPFNFAPVGGVSLFAGARLRGWQAYLLPLALMAVTDPLLGGYSFATPFVYASFLISVWLGRRLLRNSESPLRIGGVAAASSLQFFLISNFAVWLHGVLYPVTLSGLAQCFTMAIPFYGRTLAADLFYSAVFFGLHAWLSRTVVVSERVQPAVA